MKSPEIGVKVNAALQGYITKSFSQVKNLIK